MRSNGRGGERPLQSLFGYLKRTYSNRGSRSRSESRNRRASSSCAADATAQVGGAADEMEEAQVESICARLCQLPQYLGDGGDVNEDEPETFMARINSPRNAEGDRLVSSVSMLKRESPEESILWQYMASEDETSALVNADSENKAFYQADNLCCICSDNVATHFAYPCRHSACKVCFGRWLLNNGLCMTCSIPIEKLHRYSLSLVPMTLSESLASKGFDADDTAKLLVSRLCQSFEKCMRKILIVKDELEELAFSFHTAYDHLCDMTQSPAGSHLSFDSIESILMVEQCALSESFGKYSSIFIANSIWNDMDCEISTLLQYISSFHDILGNDRPTEMFLIILEDSGCFAMRQVVNGDEGGVDLKSFAQKNDSNLITCISGEELRKGILDPTLLKHEREVLETIMSPTTIMAQWKRIIHYLYILGSENKLIKGIMRILRACEFLNTGISSPSMSSLSRSIMRVSREMRKHTNKEIENLIAKSSLVADQIQRVS